MNSPLFIFNLLLAILWLYLFWRQQKTRQEMVVIGVVALLFSPLFIFLGRAEASGTIDLSDLIFSFFLSGIAAVIFESVFGKHYRAKHRAFLPVKGQGERWFLRLMLTITAWSWLAILFLLILHTNALQSLVVAGLIIGSYIVASRKDLFWNALWSAILMALTFFLLYVLAFFSNLPQTANFFFPNLPSDALLWAMTLGFVLGPMYEYARGLKLRN